MTSCEFGGYPPLASKWGKPFFWFPSAGPPVLRGSKNAIFFSGRAISEQQHKSGKRHGPMVQFFRPFSWFLNASKDQTYALWRHFAQNWHSWLHCTCLCHERLKRNLLSINVVPLCAATGNASNDTPTSEKAEVNLTFSLSSNEWMSWLLTWFFRHLKFITLTK